MMAASDLRGFGMFRLYGPEEAAFDESFVLPDIEKVK